MHKWSMNKLQILQSIVDEKEKELEQLEQLKLAADPYRRMLRDVLYKRRRHSLSCDIKTIQYSKDDPEYMELLELAEQKSKRLLTEKEKKERRLAKQKEKERHKIKQCKRKKNVMTELHLMKVMTMTIQKC